MSFVESSQSGTDTPPYVESTVPVHGPEPKPTSVKAKKKSSTDCIIPKTIFRRCVKEYSNGKHITDEALHVLQTESESHVVRYLSDVARVASNSGRKTVLVCDTNTVKEIYRNHRNCVHNAP